MNKDKEIELLKQRINNLEKALRLALEINLELTEELEKLKKGKDEYDDKK